MLMRVRTEEKVMPKFEDKPGKNEISHYFRSHTYRCINCDSKRSMPCDHKISPKH